MPFTHYTDRKYPKYLEDVSYPPPHGSQPCLSLFPYYEGHGMHLASPDFCRCLVPLNRATPVSVFGCSVVLACGGGEGSRSGALASSCCRMHCDSCSPQPWHRSLYPGREFCFSLTPSAWLRVSDWTLVTPYRYTSTDGMARACLYAVSS